MVKSYLNQIPVQPFVPRRPLPQQAVKERHIHHGFSSHLQEEISKEILPLTISKHASERMEERGIFISTKTWNKVSEKVSEARTKGVNESLIVLKDAALIVSAKNKTVITAMDRREAGEQIFTNINGTIILD